MDKDKIAQFNANSEWVIFAASSLGELDIDSAYGLPMGSGYRGVVRADKQGFLLVDLADYPPSLHTESLKKQRRNGIRTLDTAFAPGNPVHKKYRPDADGYYKLKGTRGEDWKLDNEGYVLFWDRGIRRWVYYLYIIDNKIGLI